MAYPTPYIWASLALFMEANSWLLRHWEAERQVSHLPEMDALHSFENMACHQCVVSRQQLQAARWEMQVDGPSLVWFMPG